VDVRLLGPLEVRLEDEAIELGPRKQRAVLAMLALAVGRTVSVDRLAEGLWGDEPPASAPKMVQLYVSHLRRALDGHGAGIVTRGRGYELQLPADDVDAVRFERLLDGSRAREALALWRGDVLADVADEPFAAAEIRRLEALRLRAAECAIDADLAAGRHAEVIGELDELVAANPLRERLHAQRMLALYRSGRQSDALESYRDARSGLVDEIGVEPGAELQRLHEAILAHDAVLDLPAAAEAEPATAPRPPPRRPARGLLIGAAAILIAGITAFGVIRVLEDDGLPGIDENAVGLIDPEGGRITKQYSVGGRPAAAVAGGGSVWIANGADGTVSRIDREHDDEVVTIDVGGSPAALAFGGGSLWVADSDSRTVAQVDASANRVRQRFVVGNAPRALAFAGGALWVASGVDGRIRRLDLQRARLTQEIPVGPNPSAIAAGAGALWVASEESGTVTRIEPRTGAALPAIPVGNGPSAVAVGEGAVWVVNRHDGTLARLNPATNQVSWSVGVGKDPTAVAVGEGAIWVAGGDDGTVARVDPDGPRKAERFKTGSRPSAIAVAGGSVWAAADAPQAAHRGGTLRVSLPHAPGAAIPVDWLHPLAYTNIVTNQVSSLAYDGLVAYRRVEGAAGATLVGALATTAPAPSNDGLTYVFSLRPGLRYSDGRPVRPTDFKASVERFLQATRDYPPSTMPPLFDGIVGVRRCIRSTTRCDLSRGIETNVPARTITIHLTQPDSDLLHKLTMHFAAVVPAGSPARATTGRPPPGTGPYRFVAWDAHRGGALVRNRYFRSSPARSRGEGFADRIEVSVHEAKTIERRIAAVERGDADLAVLADVWGTLVSERRLRALLARRPGQVHSRPAATTDWIFLNTKERPFDDLRVRQAVNLAIDRAKVVELAGGPAVGELTCQVVPSGFPGYAPYCPYTASPTKSGAWTAPDVAQARRLVAASGRTGAHVVVRVPDFREPIGRYYAELLDDLGFRTTVRVVGFNDDDTWDPRAHVQTGFVGWGADTLGASGFIDPLFTCAGRGTFNLSRLCDPRLERLSRRAIAGSPAGAAAAWAAAEHRLIDLAAALPLTRRRSVVLVSERAGNVRTHAQFFTLLDQMWVR
jgi:ABC-type transport system substrate-binding protein/DNA-binding SARP family transcriptional activator/DNA-binding beta-propeller fold protein YncE